MVYFDLVQRKHIPPHLVVLYTLLNIFGLRRGGAGI